MHEEKNNENKYINAKKKKKNKNKQVDTKLAYLYQNVHAKISYQCKINKEFDGN